MARKVKLVNCAAIQIIEERILILCRGHMGKCKYNSISQLGKNELCTHRKARRGKAEGFLCKSWEAKKELAKQLFYEMEQGE